MINRVMRKGINYYYTSRYNKRTNSTLVIIKEHGMWIDEFNIEGNPEDCIIKDRLKKRLKEMEN